MSLSFSGRITSVDGSCVRLRSSSLRYKALPVKRGIRLLCAVALFAVGSIAQAALVTPSAGLHGRISPATPQSVETGDRAVFSVIADAGFTASVDGSCGGALVGTTYTTNPVTAVDCTVVATFAPLVVAYAVESTQLGGNGTVAPLTTQSVNSGSVATFSVTPNAGFAGRVGGSCGGVLANNTYTTNPISADCTVVVEFVALERAAGSVDTLKPWALLALVLGLAGFAMGGTRRMLLRE
jgi:hypothetical protein